MPALRIQAAEAADRRPAAPGKSARIIASGRARAVKAGHTSNYKRSNGKIVD
jgi:hypothetical protein